MPVISVSPGNQGSLRAAALPVARRQQTAQFTADVDAGRRTETELGQELMQPVYAHGQRQIVKIHVTGFGNRAVQIDGAVPGAFPVAVLAILARQLVEAGTVGMGLGAGDALFQSPQTDEWFDGRSGRILAAQRPVEQRALGVGVQRVVGFRVDAVDEQVRVVGGLADEGQYIAVIGVDNHRSTGVVAEGLLGDVLQFGVQRQVKVLAGHRWGAHQGAQYPALGIGFHLAETDFAVQHILVGSFDADLANVRGAAVVGSIDALQVAFVDPSDITERVGRQRAVRVVARQAGDDVDAGELVPVDGKARHFLVAEVKAQRYRLEGRRACAQVVETLAIDVADIDQLCQPVQRALHVAYLLGGDLEPVGGQVVGQDETVAVEDQSAVGRQRQDLDAVVVGQSDEVFVRHHLQVNQPSHQGSDQQRGEHQCLDRTLHEQAAFEQVILYGDRVCHALLDREIDAQSGQYAVYQWPQQHTRQRGQPVTQR